MAVVTLTPNANGDSSWSGFAGAASQWEAVKTNDGDASYASQCWPYGDATGLFQLDALPAGVGAISKIDVVYTIRRSHNNLGSFSTQIKTGGTQYQGSGGIRYFSNTGYINGGDTWTVNPNTGLPWTVADINALQAGAWLSSNFWCTFCTQVYVVVTYTALALPTTTTQPAIAIAATQANLNGILANDGGEACESSFEWGLTAGYGNETPWQSGKGSGDAFTQVIASLEPDTIYHFQSQARNSVGSVAGTDMTFRTLKEILPVPGSLLDQSLRLLLEDEP